MIKRLILLLLMFDIIATARSQTITAAEYFFNTEPGAGNGTSIPIGTPGDIVNFTASISTASLANGFHFVAIRVRDANGIWSHFDRRGFYLSPSTTDVGDIIAAEYFFDADPGVGNGTSLSVGTPGPTVNFSVPIPTALSPGFHFLAIRVKDADGRWGLFERRGFYISAATTDVSNIVAAEYFFDTDPGVGNGTALSVGAPGATVSFAVGIPTSLAAGFHFLAIRVKDADGNWGLFERRGLYISEATTDVPDITAAEYFFDADPGVGNGTPASVGTSGSTVNFTAVIPTSLTEGFHFLAIRTKGSDGKWGLFERRGFHVSTATDNSPIIVAAEYFLNSDPGVGNGTPLNITTPGDVITQTFSITPGLPLGTHNLAIRLKGQDGKWGLYDYGPFTVGNSTISCPANASANTGVGECTAVVNNLDPTVNPTQPYNYTLVGATSGSGSGTVSGMAFNAGATTVTYSLTASPSVTCSFTVTVTAVAPVITSQPATQSVCVGSNVTFTVSATGTGLIYQWRKGGVNIAGATGSSYTINNAVGGDAGNYDVVVSTNCGTSVTSSIASLTVGATTINTQPASQAVCPGANVTFTVSATGTGLTYQWRKGGVNIGGATSASYTINGVVAGDAGNYDVIITSACGTTTSNTASLTINAITVITAQPASQTVCPGGNVAFTVAASGTGVLTYQWRKGGVNIGGATSASYTINGVVTSDAGNYDVVVTGDCGTVTSSSGVLTVNTTTAITVQPANQSSCLGGSVTFNVTASGTSVSYQWKKDGVDIGGATASGYTINPVSAGDAATYSVVVSGTCGSVTSSGATLTITAGTVINTQPANQSSCLGGSVTFSVSASGSGTLTYQWRKNGVNIGGANSSSYTINPVASGDVANYDVVVASNCGSTTSNPASLSLLAATNINTQPVSQSVCAGSNVTFTVAATGTGTLTYQWRKDGVDIGGATASSYTINAVAAGDVATYTVIVTGVCGSVTSSGATLSLIQAPAITVQPANQSSCLGGSVTFSVTATGAGLSYQWKKDGVDISGATSSSYTINPVTAGDAATYSVVVTGTCGTVISNGVTLTITAGTIINTQPVAQSSCLGSSVTFSVSASGSGTLTYQWKKDGVDISGATSSSYTINPVTAGDAANYSVVVSSGCGSTTSNSVTLTIISSTVITAQPTNQTVCSGANATFTITATGANLTYQWRKAGVNIGGATSSSYTIAAVSTGDVGNYDVIVTGTCGAVTSNTISLALGNIVISSQPASQTVCTGANVTFTVSATGSGISYQWRKGGVNISGATLASYTITGVAIADAGSYDVIVSGTCGTVTSSAAVLTVNSLPSITTQPTAQVVCLGGNVTFTVIAAGSGITYQWRKGGVNIGGATSASYTITGVVAGDAGNYDVVVTGVCPSAVTSNAAALTITPSPAITVQPASQTVFVGSSVTFNITASGSGLTYQWRKAGVNIPGATGSSYTINNVAVGDAGNYDVVVAGTCPPATTSNVAVLTVNTITITTQPANQTVCVGANAVFSVIVAGSNPTYQWQVSTSGGPFTNISNATASSLSLTSVTTAMNGNFYRCVVSGSLTSNAALLRVNAIPVVTLTLPFDTLNLNSPVQTLSGGLPSGGVYSGSGISGSTLLPSSLTLANYTVTYRFTDAIGCSASATDVFTVIPPTAKLNIFPNPAVDGKVILVVSPDMVGTPVTIIDAMGRKVYQWTIPGRYTSYQFNLPSGTYSFVFRYRQIQFVKRIIIVR